jgi:hypothetical protein
MSTPILTMDFETDPFEFGVNPRPFACGIYDGQNFDSIWSPKCASRMLERLKSLPPSTIYMHNGGKFDIFFILESLEAEMLIINGRVVSAHVGKHEVRDSFAIIPVALSQYKKDDIDINKLHRDSRAANRVEILSYLRGDCVYLHELVSAFHEEFGDKMTIGSAAMQQLKKFHPYKTINSRIDKRFREDFFRGGRVQVFQSGILKKKFKILDENSMYPDAMKNFKHPNAVNFDVDNKITKDTAFIIAEGRNYGAFAVRNAIGGLDFTRETGRFNCTIHEWSAALDTKMFEPIKVVKTFGCSDWISFDGFVDHFFAGRVKAKAEGNKILDLFYKLILNSAYGKFAQNPDSFCDHCITRGGHPGEGWEARYSHGDGKIIIWEKPKAQIGKFQQGYYNVAIGASITGAGRSKLMQGIAAATDLIYCDTDSLICRDLPGIKLSDTELGAWKLEGHGTSIAVAGKKMYACFDGNVCIKKATKGARLTPEEIVKVAGGQMVKYRNAAPNFKLNGQVKFIEREIRRTV